jgi:hypothetical protein
VELSAKKMDYGFHADGSNLYADPGTLARSNAGWITITPAQLTVPPRETLAISYAIDVPPQSELTGTYWCIIMVEPVIQPYNVEPQKDKTVLGVQTVMRYGIQVSTHIAGTGKKLIKVTSKSLVETDDGAVLRLTLANEGDTLVNPEIWVQLFSENGAPLGRFEGESKRIYPDCSVRLDILLKGIGVGKYTALVVAEMKDEDVIGFRYNLSIE